MVATNNSEEVINSCEVMSDEEIDESLAESFPRGTRLGGSSELLRIASRKKRSAKRARERKKEKRAERMLAIVIVIVSGLIVALRGAT